MSVNRIQYANISLGATKVICFSEKRRQKIFQLNYLVRQYFFNEVKWKKLYLEQIHRIHHETTYFNRRKIIYLILRIFESQISSFFFSFSNFQSTIP